MLLSACSLCFQIKHTKKDTAPRYISRSHQISLCILGAIGGSEALDAANPKARTKSARRAPSGGRPDIPSGGREACYSKHLMNPMQDLSNCDVPGAIRIVKVLWISLNLKPQVFPTAFLCRNWKSCPRLRPASAVAKSWLLQPLLTLHMHVPMPRKGAMAMGHLCGSSHGDHWQEKTHRGEHVGTMIELYTWISFVKRTWLLILNFILRYQVACVFILKFDVWTIRSLGGVLLKISYVAHWKMMPISKISRPFITLHQLKHALRKQKTYEQLISHPNLGA